MKCTGYHETCECEECAYVNTLYAELEYLENFYSDDREEIERYLISFEDEYNKQQTIEMDVYQDEQSTILFSEEINYLTENDKSLLYYLIDRWTINNLI